MKLVASHLYKPGRDATTGQCFRRIVGILKDSGMRALPIRFALADLDPGASGIGRLLKRHPALKAFLHESEGARVLDNLDERWEAGDARRGSGHVAVETLAEVADGVPKSFPLRRANFSFEHVPWTLEGIGDPTVADLGERKWNDLGACVPPRYSPMPGITLASHWWLRRREIGIRVNVGLPMPGEDVVALPPPPPATQAILAEFGRVPRPELQFYLDPAERARMDRAYAGAQDLKQQWQERSSEVLAGLPLPHELPPNPSPRGWGFTSPHKDALITALRPLGFSYRSAQSGHGVYALCKPTRLGNCLWLVVDVGSVSNSCSCDLRLEGPGWDWSIALPVTPQQRHNQYPIASAEVWRQIVENLAVVCAHAEKHVISEGEQLFPRTPRWFACG